MSVALIPPVSSSAGDMRNVVALVEGPRFVRTRAMSRWHRPRSGRRWPDGVVSYDLWCGGGFVRGDFLAVDDAPAGELVCGPCDGRAVGAGQEQQPADRELVFTPRWMRPPSVCPAGRQHGWFTTFPGGRVGECLVCGAVEPIRAKGGPYSGYTALVAHKPGPRFPEPCPFHAWQYLTVADGQVLCSPCERPLAQKDGAL